MKIALFHNLPPGGAKRAVFEETKYLSKNHDIELFRYSSTDENFLDIRPFVQKIHTYDFDMDGNKRGFRNRLYNDWQNLVMLRLLSQKIAADINDCDYDIVLIHPDKFTQAPFLNRYLDLPTLYFCEEYLRIVYEDQFKFKEKVSVLKLFYETFTRLIRKSIDRYNSLSADLVISNSKFTKANIEKTYGIKAYYCHLGVDPTVFKRIRGNRNKYIVFVGDEFDKLGYGLAKNVIDLLKSRNIKLVSLGFSEKSKRVTNDKLMASEYSGAIATICTHKNEPFGIPPLESMACETPVLAVNEGGYKETVVDGVTGYLLPRDPKVFAEKIEYLIKNPAVARRMGKAGREHVKKNFTWDKHNKKLERILIKTAYMYK